MKRKILVWASLGLVLLMMSGCDWLLGGVTADARVADFLSDVNAENWSDLYLHFHPDDTSVYNAIQDPTFWTTGTFDASHANQYLENQVWSADNLTLTADLRDDGVQNVAVQFTFAEYSDFSVYIDDIYVDLDFSDTFDGGAEDFIKNLQ